MTVVSNSDLVAGTAAVPQASAGSHLSIRGLGKTYGGHAALADVELEIGAGQYVVLLGPSGSGKTTLLSMIGGFTVPTRGRIAIGGKDVTALPPARRPTATVFQDYALFPHLTVEANVAFPLAMRDVARAERPKRVAQALDLVGLAGFGRRRIHELSGGQRQRVALARALLVEPEILLLDEPLGALDLHLRRQVQDELKALQRRTGRTFVHVTHDQEEAMVLADLIVIVHNGRIEDAGTPQRLYQRPATRFVAEFMGESSLIEGRVAAAGEGRVTLETPLGAISLPGKAMAGAMGTIAIRPENWLAGPRPDDAVTIGRATVIDSVFQGATWRVRARCQGIELLLRLPPDRAVSPGDSLDLSCRERQMVFLDR
ncbi:ABC transporter ATP-binding protein [Zavarzinia sp.]|uniref:ABC transporter ATP-binding protein n=1 Tax=Zavarzinia sp. TaxID=2027920 RepID=UPI00356392ED